MMEMLREAGIRADRALAAAGLRRSDVERPDEIITGEQELRLERAFVEATRERRDLWLEIASAIDCCRTGRLASRSCPLEPLRAPSSSPRASTSSRSR